MLVQYIAIVILIILTVYAFYDFKKAVLIWLPFKLLFNNQVAVRYAAPGMALVIAGDLALIAIYYLRGNTKDLYNAPFLLKKPMTAFAFSYALSTIFTLAPFQSALIAAVKFFSSGFCMLFLLQRCLKNTSDIRLLLKSCLAVSFLIVLLAISENILRTNVWLDFLYYNSPVDIESGRMYYVPGAMEMRYGLIKSKSFFSFHIPFGFACVCLYWLLFYFSRQTKIFQNTKWLTISAYMLIAGVVMSLSKQAYLGLFVMILSLYHLNTVLNIKTITPLIIVFAVILIYAPEYLNIILSLSDEKLAEEGGGSTVALREYQYNVAFEMFRQNPFIGNGIGSIEIMRMKESFSGILGAESSWLSILPERGILGAMTYLYLYGYLWSFKRCINAKILFFFLMSIFVVENAGGIKDISIWGMVLLVVYRYNEIMKVTSRMRIIKT